VLAGPAILVLPAEFGLLAAGSIRAGRLLGKVKSTFSKFNKGENINIWQFEAGETFAVLRLF